MGMVLDGLGFFSLVFSEQDLGMGSVNKDDQLLSLEELKSAPPLARGLGEF